MRRICLALTVMLCAALPMLAQNVTEGALFARGRKGAELGACPLKHTKVRADIAGYTARVTVEQEFENNFTEPIEAVYTFPLSQNAAVDRMTMRVGERTIKGQIMKREEARQVFEQAKAEGKTAALLDQQRPNIFTQSVANILPGEKIVVEISYVEILKYEDGQYEFVFPMTVGPRYIPGSVGAAEAQAVSPPVAAERAGHDIALEVNLDAGVPVEGILSTSHPIAVANLSPSSAKISLREERTIPNKDFILRYDVTGGRIKDAVLAHKDARGGFFTLILQPPDAPAPKDVTPKEIVFVLDTSGSMSGFPIEKAKEAMKLSLDNLHPQDTFNLITFAGDTHVLFEKPVPATPENLARAQAFLASRSGAGGTEMMKAIRAALAPTDSNKHLRVVCFMTDGYVGNEPAIIAEIQRHPQARVFAFGIGNSVNRFLLDKMAEEGRGEVEYVALTDDGSRAARRFYERVRSPMLTDIAIDWNNLPVADVYPEKPGDLFSAKPLVLSGRYTKAANGVVKIRGKVGGQTLVREVPVAFPENEPDHDVLATLWARKKVDALMSEYYRAGGDAARKTGLQTEITSLALEFRLLTQFTSFVAVEDRVVNQNGKPQRVEVPVELPDGMSRESDSPFRRMEIITSLQRAPQGTTFSGLLQAAPNARTEPLAGGVRVDGTSGAENAFVVDGAEVLSLRNGQPNAANAAAKAAAPVDEIVKRLGNHQRALKSLRATVDAVRFDAAKNVETKQRGNLVSVPRKDLTMRVDWTQPRAETLAIVRNQFVLYRPDAKQARTGSADGEARTALAILLTLDAVRLKENYDVRYLGETTADGAKLWQLELKPKTPNGLRGIVAFVDASGMIVSLKAVDEKGNWTSAALSGVQKNPAVGAKDFEIELPEDTTIIKGCSNCDQESGDRN